MAKSQACKTEIKALRQENGNKVRGMESGKQDRESDGSVGEGE